MHRLSQELARKVALPISLAIGTLGITSCTSDESATRSVPQETVLQPDYSEAKAVIRNIGITIDEGDSASAYEDWKISPEDALSDATSRIATLPGPSSIQPLNQLSTPSTESVGAYTKDSFKDAQGSYIGLPVWKLELTPSKVEDSTTETFLPIFKIDSSNKEGAMTLTDLRPPLNRLSDDNTKEMQTIVEQIVMPSYTFVHEALEQGAAKSIYFVYSDSGIDIEKEFGTSSSSFSPETRNVVIELPKIKQASVADVRSTLDHELTHAFMSDTALSNNNDIPDPANREARLRKDCAVIREAFLSEKSDELIATIGLYEKIKSLQPESSPQIDIVIQKLREGEVSELQYSTEEEDIKKGYLSECAGGGRPIALIGYARTQILKQTTEAPEIPEANKDRYYDILDELSTSFSDIVRSSQILKTISEHGYGEEKLAGHPEDNFEELSASLVAIARHYPDEFETNLRKLPELQKDAIVSAYGLIRAAIVEKNSDLASEIPKINP